MNEPSAGNHFHGDTVIGIQNTGGTIHNAQVNQQGAHAGPRTHTQQAADILQALADRLEAARRRGDLSDDDAETALAIVTNPRIDAESEESRSKLVRLVKRAGLIVGSSAASAKAVAEAAEAIGSIGQ